MGNKTVKLLRFLDGAISFNTCEEERRSNLLHKLQALEYQKADCFIPRNDGARCFVTRNDEAKQTVQVSDTTMLNRVSIAR